MVKIYLGIIAIVICLGLLYTTRDNVSMINPLEENEETEATTPVVE